MTNEENIQTLLSVVTLEKLDYYLARIYFLMIGLFNNVLIFVHIICMYVCMYVCIYIIIYI